LLSGRDRLFRIDPEICRRILDDGDVGASPTRQGRKGLARGECRAKENRSENRSCGEQDDQ
jgi:hypothetical protein